MSMTESQRQQLYAMRGTMDTTVAAASESAAQINAIVTFVRPWKPAAYVIGDVRAYDSVPYKCVQAHDSTANPDWYPPAVPALWMQYHGTSKDTARPWVAPLGAHDMYLAGEWMIYTDGALYECVQDTNFSPADYPAAWHKDEK